MLEILTIFSMVFMGLPVIFFTYLFRRGYYIKKYFNEKPSGESVNRVSVTDDVVAPEMHKPSDDLKGTLFAIGWKQTYLKMLAGVAIIIVIASLISGILTFRNANSKLDAMKQIAADSMSVINDNRIRDSISRAQVLAAEVRKLDSINAVIEINKRRSDSLEAAIKEKNYQDSVINEQSEFKTTEQQNSGQYKKVYQSSGWVITTDTAFIYPYPNSPAVRYKIRTDQYFRIGKRVHYDSIEGRCLHVSFYNQDNNPSDGWIRKNVTDYKQD